MPKFLMLLHEPPAAFMELSPEEMQDVIAEYTNWRQKMFEAEICEDGWKLTNEGGRLVSGGNGKLSVTDGPYSEAKEVLGGLFLIQARDYEHAVEVAESCPHMKFGRIEVRKIDLLED